MAPSIAGIRNGFLNGFGDEAGAESGRTENQYGIVSAPTHTLSFSQNTSQGFQGFSRRDHPVEPAREPSEIKSRPTASQCKIDRDPFPAGLTAEPPRRGFQKILGPRRQHFASRGEIPSETKRKKQKQKKKRKIFNESDRHTGTKKTNKRTQTEDRVAAVESISHESIDHFAMSVHARSKERKKKRKPSKCPTTPKVWGPSIELETRPIGPPQRRRRESYRNLRNLIKKFHKTYISRAASILGFLVRDSFVSFFFVARKR